MASIKSDMSIHRFFKSPVWDFELTRLLGSAPFGGCDAAEFLQAVGELRRHDGESWYSIWFRLAESAMNSAQEAIQMGLGPLAKGFLLRACNYYRVAPYMLAGVASSTYPLDERSFKCLKRSAEAFDQATTYMDMRVLNLVIAFTDPSSGISVDMPARLLVPSESKRLKKQQKTPVVICVGGADSTMQELFFLLGAMGPEVGYAVLLFNGPGQGDVFAGGSTLLRPDFEGVVSAVLDHLWTLAQDRPDIRLDLDRVSLAGMSMGAYFSLHTAAVDDRVAAVIAGDPIVDMWELALTRLPSWFARGWLAGWIPDAILDTICRTKMRLDFPTRWEFNTAMALMGQKSPADLLREFRRYTLNRNVPVASGPASQVEGDEASVEIFLDGRVDSERKDIAPMLSCIRCPVFLTGAYTALYQDSESTTARLAQSLVNVPPSKLEVWIPTTVSEGAMTAKVGAWYNMACKTFMFLDRQLDIKRSR